MNHFLMSIMDPINALSGSIKPISDFVVTIKHLSIYLSVFGFYLNDINT